jgi:hypothetical protein
MIFSKRSRIGVSIVFCFFIFMAIANAEQPLIISGQNNPAVDLPAVQAAVDQGGMIRLNGTFDFGSTGSITIKKDIDIAGEKGTLVKGGRLTFNTKVPDQLPPVNPGPKVSIRDIHFDGAVFAPINLAYIRSAVVRGNKITNVIAVKYTAKMDTNTGIIIGPRVVRPKAYVPGVATGTIIIMDNEIDVTPANLLKTMGWGVFIAWTTGANLIVTRNVISGAGRAAIGSLDNYLGPDGTGKTLIAYNQITTPTEGFYYPTNCAPNGIMAGWYFDMSATLDHTKNAPVEVSHNKIVTNGKWSNGIITSHNGAVVNSNDVRLMGGQLPQSRGIASMCPNVRAVGNKVSGTAAIGFYFFKWGPCTSSNGYYMNNELRDFTGLHADLDFVARASNNIWIGPYGSLADEGTGNQFYP